MRASNESMHNHDLDMIAAYAEGTLEDQTQARHLVDTCDECRAEFEAQTAVLQALTAVPSVSMTEHEKASLHRDLWTELRSERKPEPVGRPWWHRVGYVAAGIVVIVATGGVLSQFQGADTAETFQEIGTGLAEGSDQVADTAEESMDQADTTEAASAEAPTALSDGAMEDAGIDFAALAEEIREGQARVAGEAAIEDESLLSELTDCVELAVERAGAADQRIITELAGYVVTAPVQSEVLADAPLTFVSSKACEIVHVAE